MNNFQNNKFIKTKLSTILEDCIVRVNNIDNHMDFFLLNEFILQTVFLKLTGAQEQKFKSMQWEWGSMDLDYRDEILRDKDKTDVYPKQIKYSTYGDKASFINKIYNKISSMIKLENNILCNDDGNHLNDRFINETKKCIIEIFDKPKSFYSFSRAFIEYKKAGFITNKELELKINNKNELIVFDENFKNNCYEKLYKYRNKCAHNSFVYQNPFPTLDELCQKDKNNNIFRWFQTLLIFDEISIYFFEKLEKY